MKRQIYADTSVIGGCFDANFEGASKALLERFIKGLDLLVLSDLTIQELGRAPKEVRNLVDEVPGNHKIELEFIKEAAELAELYIESKVIGSANRIDAQHIATATVHKVDVLVSWNFRHIVSLKRIHGYNSVNMRRGYPLLEIRTPEEVLDDDDDS